MNNEAITTVADHRAPAFPSMEASYWRNCSSGLTLELLFVDV